MTIIELVGLRFDGYGRPGNQTAAAGALRREGIARPSSGKMDDAGDIAPPEQSAERGPNGLINEYALLHVKQELSRRVESSISRGRFPLVVGGDCSALLGSLTGARDALGDCGLLHIDGHEDTTPIDASEDGEAANSEIGMLLGMVGRGITGDIGEGLPALERGALALLGQRDDQWRRDLNLGSLETLGVWKRGWEAIAADAAGAARAAVAHVRHSVGEWWLHIDVDVMDPIEFPAQGLPDFPDEPGGLTRAQLADLVSAAAAEAGCVGASIAIYDPNQDPEGSGAKYVVKLAHQIVQAVNGGRR